MEPVSLVLQTTCLVTLCREYPRVLVKEGPAHLFRMRCFGEHFICTVPQSSHVLLGGRSLFRNVCEDTLCRGGRGTGSEGTASLRATLDFGYGDRVVEGGSR